MTDRKSREAEQEVFAEEVGARRLADRARRNEPKSDPAELRRDIDQTRAELGDTVEALSRKANVKAQVRQRIEGRKAALRERRDRLTAKATDVRGRASSATPEDARRAASQVAHTAEERPFPAIGVAVALGLLLGWLIGRR
jgi:ElaB/YqjD/DUF883 family membrane-anchored ribosome-binding protein